MQSLSAEFDSLKLFNKIFVPPEDPSATPRPPIVDRVLEDYKRLRNSNRRLSADDRQRLDAYIGQMAELQRKLNVRVSCGNVPIPTKMASDFTDPKKHPDYKVNPAKQIEAWQLMNDVIVAAFACDRSRVATVFIDDDANFSTFAGGWHDDIAHVAWKDEQDPIMTQRILMESRQRIFEHVFLDLANKLNQVAEIDGTLLDQTLLQWTQESGPTTHYPIEFPVITAGSAGGFFRTGQYLDYRNLNVPGTVNANDMRATNVGLVYNQWLGTVLQSMGLSPSEYEFDGNGGYGHVKMATDISYSGFDKYDAQLKVMSEVLPFLKA